MGTHVSKYVEMRVHVASYRYVPAKKTRPPGQVKRSGWCGSQTSSMFSKARLSTTIWMKHEKVVATTCERNMVRGGIFI